MNLPFKLSAPHRDEMSPNPPFLETRVSTYYDRLSKIGSHLLKGRLPDRDAILLVSNDYLDLGDHPEVIEARVAALREAGRALLRSDVFRHGPGPLREFEQNMASFMQAEDTVICQSGWAANVGLIQSIAGPDTPVYLDMHAHTSMWEGTKSAGAKGRPFRHSDPDSLEKMHRRFGPGIVVVETVYSTSGGLCPLRDIVAVAERFGSVLVVDESHSLGLFGRHGAGITVAEGLAHRVHFRTASLSKAFASRGGLICGSARNMEFFRYESFPAIFSSGVLPFEAEGFNTTLRLIKAGKALRKQLQANAAYLRKKLPALDYDIGETRSQIISLVAGSEAQTLVLRNALESRGVFGSVFCWPATPRNRALIRFSVNSSLSTVELERIIAVCAEIRDEIGLYGEVQTPKEKNGAPLFPAAVSHPGQPVLVSLGR
ncbi:MAG: alpha-hydroxyketone-type quorum-sensing autoinducer synthase [Candidatus Neomarinimicrobiota bacterium]